MIGQPNEIATGPPLFQASPERRRVPARTEMIVNDIAKLVKPLQGAIELLLEAQLGEPLLVLVRGWLPAGPASQACSRAPPSLALCGY